MRTQNTQGLLLTLRMVGSYLMCKEVLLSFFGSFPGHVSRCQVDENRKKQEKERPHTQKNDALYQYIYLCPIAQVGGNYFQKYKILHSKFRTRGFFYFSNMDGNVTISGTIWGPNTTLPMWQNWGKLQVKLEFYIQNWGKLQVKLEFYQVGIYNCRMQT